LKCAHDSGLEGSKKISMTRFSVALKLNFSIVKNYFLKPIVCGKISGYCGGKDTSVSKSISWLGDILVDKTSRGCNELQPRITQYG